jgi:general stress protein 26
VSYAQPSKYEFVSLIGRARIVVNRQQVHELWSEACVSGFPTGLMRRTSRLSPSR